MCVNIIEKKLNKKAKIINEPKNNLDVFKTHADVISLEKIIGTSQKSELPYNGNESETLHIPLRFWFNRNPGLALPLIALQYHEVKLFIKTASFEKLWLKSLKKYRVQRANNNKVTIIM